MEPTEAELDQELDEIIEELRTQGMTDDDIVEFFAEMKNEAEEASTKTDGDEESEEDETEIKPEPINLMEVADAVINQQPARVAEIFDAAMKAKLEPMVDDYKQYLAATLFDPPEENEEDEESEDENEGENEEVPNQDSVQ